MPSGVFLSTVALLEAYYLTKDPSIQLPYCHGEYLSQGVLDLPPGCAITATLEQLNSLGLDEIYSPPKRHLLWRAVDSVRETINNGPKQEVTTSEWKTIKAIAIGTCNKTSKVACVVALLLLSIKPRYRLDTKILEVFAANGWGKLVRMLA